MTADLTVGSMFSGVEGMGLGVLAALGGRIVWHAETDPHASAVLARHFDAPNLGDVRTVDWSQVEPVDLLIGGPPCQAVSQAGRGLGTADERWMWPEAFRAMDELRPRWVLWENPMGLLTGRQREDDDDASGGGLEPGDESVGVTPVDSGWFGHVLGEMASLGYVGRWGCLRSSDTGAPHARARVFIAASDTDDADLRLGRRVPHGAAEPSGRHQQDLAERAASSGEASPVALLPTPSASMVANSTDVTFSGDGREMPNKLGWAVALLPTPRASDQHGSGVHGDGGPDLRTTITLLPTPRVGGDSTQGTDGGYHADGYSRMSIDDVGRYADDRWAATLPDGRTIDYGPAIRRWETICGEPAPHARDDKGRLNPDLPRWMLGLPRGWLDGIPRTAQLRCAGNGCQPQTARLAAELLLAAAVQDDWAVAS